MKSIIRWKFVVPAGILLTALIVFFVIFFDPLASHFICKAASKVNGAKVEMSGFHTKFAAGRLEIGKLMVTNRKEPMQNIVECGPMTFQLEPSEAIRMRFVIDDASIHNLQFNTPRKSSGALPALAKKEDKSEGEPGPAEKLADKYKGRFKLSFAGLKGEVQQRIQFDPKDLAVTKKADDLKAKADSLPQDWQKRIDALNADQRLKQISADLDSVKQTKTSGSDAITAVPAALKKLKDTRDAIDKLKSDVKQTRDSFTGDLSNLKGGIAGLQDAKKQDVDGLLSRLNLDFANPEHLMEGIIGPTVVERFQTALKYIQIARRHMPAKKQKEKAPEIARSKGIDIKFPTPAAAPRFWLKKAALDGTYESVAAAGTLSDLTDDPPRVGKPFVADFTGQRGGQHFVLNGKLDHTGDVPTDAFVVKATGIDLKSVGAAGAGSLVTKGAAAADLAFNVIGDGAIGGQIGVTMTGVGVDKDVFFKQTEVPAGATSPQDKMKETLASNIVDAVQKLPEITIAGQLFGTWSDPSIKLTSNLTSTLSDVVKNSVGDAVKQQRAELEAKINGIATQKQAELQAKVDQLQNQMNEKLKGVEAGVEKKASDAAGVNLGGGGGGAGNNSPIPGLKLPKKLFK
ncbi:MAG: TIGR03545 family protein [Elusimicrobia bacterium]|nr:TIGR03545 family protein [Elusimicrobiota bacterium]